MSIASRRGGASLFEEFDAHGCHVAGLDGFRLTDGSFDGQHVTASCLVREYGCRPRAVAYRDPDPQRAETTTWRPGQLTDLLRHVGGQADEGPTLRPPGAPTPQLGFEGDDHEPSITRRSDTGRGSTSAVWGGATRPAPCRCRRRVTRVHASRPRSSPAGLWSRRARVRTAFPSTARRFPRSRPTGVRACNPNRWFPCNTSSPRDSATRWTLHGYRPTSSLMNSAASARLSRDVSATARFGSTTARRLSAPATSPSPTPATLARKSTEQVRIAGNPSTAVLAGYAAGTLCDLDALPPRHTRASAYAGRRAVA